MDNKESNVRWRLLLQIGAESEPIAQKQANVNGLLKGITIIKLCIVNEADLKYLWFQSCSSLDLQLRASDYWFVGVCT